MKKNYIILLSIFFLFKSTYIFGIDYSDLAHDISMKTAKNLCSKYHLSLAGFGGGTMYGVEKLSLSFDINRPIHIQEARKLVLEASQIFINDINLNSAIRPYLAEYPFPLSRIELNFYVQLPRNDQGTLRAFSLYHLQQKHQIVITYSVDDENGYLNEILKETYEEAQIRIMQKGN